MKRSILPLLFISLILVPVVGSAQEVVPIGTIKPEGGAGEGGAVKRRARKRAAPTAVKAGKTFMIESAEAVSSGLTVQGETVYFRASEEVTAGKLPVIFSGAVATGRISDIEKEKKQGKIKVELQSIQASNGEKVAISGNVEIEGKGEQAAYGVGERFTATIDEKLSVKGKPKKEELPTFSKNAFAEIRGKGVKADIKKGSVKGKVELVLESSKGMSIDDVVPESLALYRVNDHLTPQEVKVIPNKPKIGDKNKNGNSDLSLEFDAWDFIKFQPRGNNMIYVKGKLKDGSEFDANTRVTIDY